MADAQARRKIGVSASVLPSGGRITAALVLLGIVALASTSRLEGGSARLSGRIGVFVLVLAVSVAVVIAAGGLAFVAPASLGDMRRRTKLVVATVALLLLTALIASLLAPARGLNDPLPCAQPCPGEGRVFGNRARSSSGTGDGWSAATVVAGSALLAAVLVVGGAVLLGARRRSRVVREPTVMEDPVTQALEESLDDLRREHDVRRAIVACYARMERALERSGSPRKPHEAPLEYLAHILERFTGTGRAARTLTELFERAKFSVEPMGERDKDAAIAALEALRSEVGIASGQRNPGFVV